MLMGMREPKNPAAIAVVRLMPKVKKIKLAVKRNEDRRMRFEIGKVILGKTRELMRRINNAARARRKKRIVGGLK